MTGSAPMVGRRRFLAGLGAAAAAPMVGGLAGCRPVTGVAFDPADHRLYVALRWAWSSGAPASGTLVPVYQIAS